MFACRKGSSRKDGQLLFWCSNNPREIDLCDSVTQTWNRIHPANAVHLQPVPEGQSSEEVILAAVVGKTTPDIYANMWQGNVEMYARAGVLIPLDTLHGFLQFIHERCDSAVIREITSVDGHIYQVPWKVNPFMTIYNKDLFAKNDIPNLPLTYSAYLHASEMFKRNSELPGATQKWFGYTEVKEIWYQRLFNFYPLYLAASGGAPLIVDNRAAFNNKYAVGVFAFLQTLYTDGYFSRENLSAADDPFVDRSTPMPIQKILYCSIPAKIRSVPGTSSAPWWIRRGICNYYRSPVSCPEEKTSKRIPIIATISRGIP
jgi:multiple sugar transport system substrate-binding protein